MNGLDGVRWGRCFETVKEDMLKSYSNVEDVIMPLRATKHSSGYDFFAPYDFDIEPNTTKVIWSDIKAFMQDNEELLVFIRSSVGIKMNVQLGNSVGKIDCVPKGTKISTPNGYKNVEDFLCSDDIEEILSYNDESNIIETDKVSDVWIVEGLDLIELETDDGNIIKIPLGKQVFTERGWIKSIDLKISDKILSI